MYRKLNKLDKAENISVDMKAEFHRSIDSFKLDLFWLLKKILRI